MAAAEGRRDRLAGRSPRRRRRSVVDGLGGPAHRAGSGRRVGGPGAAATAAPDRGGPRRAGAGPCPAAASPARSVVAGGPPDGCGRGSPVIPTDVPPPGDRSGGPRRAVGGRFVAADRPPAAPGTDRA